MIRQIPNQIDILQKRRIDNNSKKYTLDNVKRLRKRGLIYGIFITITGVTICTFTSLHTLRRIKYKQKLSSEAIEYQDLKVKYDLLNKDLKRILRINNNIAQGIIGTKSSSALLLELKQIIPNTIQLTDIESINKKLILKGQAVQPKALESINALKLQISNSFLVDNNSSLISKIETSQYREKDALTFTLISNFTELESNEIQSNYLKLGSFGLLNRVNVLKEEGLIK